MFQQGGHGCHQGPTALCVRDWQKQRAPCSVFGSATSKLKVSRKDLLWITVFLICNMETYSLPYHSVMLIKWDKNAYWLPVPGLKISGSSMLLEQGIWFSIILWVCKPRSCLRHIPRCYFIWPIASLWAYERSHDCVFVFFKGQILYFNTQGL